MDPTLNGPALRIPRARARNWANWLATRVLLVLALVLFSFDSLQAQQPAQADPRVQEAERLFEEGLALEKARDLRGAIPRYERALVLGEQVLGSEHLGLVAVIDRLAAAHQALGDYARTVTYYQRSIAIGEKALGAEHPQVATTPEQSGGAV
ncbi:MAG: tetratricopeptide repeat protein [Burkholderiales bacterium]|nr:tetratricopeptide repeat protein [Burkholderiales bacterium]